MKYAYQIVVIPKAQVLNGNEGPLNTLGASSFRVKNTWVEQDPHGITVFIFLMEKEIS